MLKNIFSKSDVQVLQSESITRGFFQVVKMLVRYRAFAGGWNTPVTREFIQKPYAVAVLPYDPIRDCVVLLEQFRIGAWAANYDPWLLEIVAGVQDRAGESCEELATRELWEESRLRPLALLPIFNYLSSPGYSTEEIRLFCARVDSRQVPKTAGLSEEGEDIRLHTLTTAEAFQALRSEQCQNGITLMALQWLELNLKRVRELWHS